MSIHRFTLKSKVHLDYYIKCVAERSGAFISVDLDEGRGCKLLVIQLCEKVCVVYQRVDSNPADDKTNIIVS